LKRDGGIVSKINQVRFDTLVRAAPGSVFDAMATAEGLDRWFTRGGSTLEPGAGGALVFRYQNWGTEDFTGEMVGEVVEHRRPDRFVFRWPVDSGGYMTTVQIDFEQHAEGTLVRLVEGVYESGDVGLQDMLNRASGWAQALTLMKFWVEHGVTY
jgi:uncharacterized protein YndB with AHSA1/START domain